MYLSVRYYFRNKKKKGDNANNMLSRSGKHTTCKSDKKKTKLKYVRIADELKTLMKQHIYDNKGNNKSPKEMFGLFHNSTNEEIRDFLKVKKQNYKKTDIQIRMFI